MKFLSIFVRLSAWIKRNKWEIFRRAFLNREKAAFFSFVNKQENEKKEQNYGKSSNISFS